MSSRRPTNAQLRAEVALLTQERDDALNALSSAEAQILRLQAQRSAPRIVELQRETTPEGDRLRVGDTVYQATITARGDGAGFKVVAPIPNSKPLIMSLSPAGIGYLPEHAAHKLMKA